jgi:O-antigen ligase
MFFTFVNFIAPQAFVPGLTLLRPAMTSGALGIVAYVLSALGSGRRLLVDAPEVKLIGLLTGLAALSIPFSAWPGGSVDFFGEHFIKVVLMFFMVVHFVDTPRRARLFVGSIVLWGVVMAIVAVRDFSTGVLEISGVRILGYSAGIARDPNDLALTLNLVLALAVGHYQAARSAGVRALLLGIAGTLIAGVIVSFSRGGFLALATVGGIVVARTVRRRGIAMLLLVLALIVVGLALLPAGYTNRLYSMVDFAYDPTGSAPARLEGMRLAVSVILENPVFGVGLGMDILALLEKGVRWGAIHNAFLQIGADLGIPGLIVYVLLIWHVLKGLRLLPGQLPDRPEAREVLALTRGLELAIYGYVVGAFFLAVPYNSYLYYIAGLGVAIRGIGMRLSGEAKTRR